MVKSALKDIQQLSYEQALKELEAIVDQLESDPPNLEESISLFDRGQALSKHCKDLLDQAELKVKQVQDVKPDEEGV